MKIEYINPFIEATEQTYQTMCGVEVLRDGDLRLLKKGMNPDYDLICTIGLSDAVKGAVLMTMAAATGRKVVKQFLGESTITDSDLTDGFGEILNIIAGAASAKLGRVQLSTPTVILGKNLEVYSCQGSPWIIIPMKFPDWGKFNIEVAMEEL